MPKGQSRIDAALSGLDALQQRFTPSAFVVAIIKRYADDRAGRQAALITFYGLLSVFPLTLLLVTFATLFIAETTLQHDVVNSVLAQFPVIGVRLKDNIKAISAGNNLALAVAVLGLTWGSLGITNSLQGASATVWRRPRSEDPRCGSDSARGSCPSASSRPSPCSRRSSRASR